MFLLSAANTWKSFFLILFTISLSACVTIPAHQFFDHTEIHFIDVGYGDAILVVRGLDTLFIDGGYPPMTDTVLRYFQNIGLTHLDALIITHPHPDHIGVAHGILEKKFPVNKVFSSYPLEHSEIPYGFRKLIQKKINNAEISYIVLRDGDTIQLPEGTQFDVIHPEFLVENLNDSSLVIYFSAFGKGALLTGDIGPEAQNRVIQDHMDVFPVSLLKAPHHGGRALESFYAIAQPELTVITDGVNPYGNPRSETLEFISRYSDSFVRLSRVGNVIVRDIPECKLLLFTERPVK